MESEAEEKLRFEIELEFVQCLSNPAYLNFLAQRGYFEDVKFLEYLDYLHYFKHPPYSIQLKYPLCLKFLDLIQDEAFRRELKKPEITSFIHEQLFYNWMFYRRGKPDC